MKFMLRAKDTRPTSLAPKNNKALNKSPTLTPSNQTKKREERESCKAKRTKPH